MHKICMSEIKSNNEIIHNSFYAWYWNGNYIQLHILYETQWKVMINFEAIVTEFYENKFINMYFI